MVHPLKARKVFGRWTGILETWSGSTLATSRSPAVAPGVTEFTTMVWLRAAG